ncbi:MAG: valine--tRNA ligase [Bacteroidota bacterium]|nr:valine--tRNA ligase [Bacteroidota bacterium]
MEIPKTYDPETIENKWYAQWLDKGYFKSSPDERTPFTILMPPPNVTGVLHMGHALNHTIQDVLIRQERMKGKNAMWLPGIDHASIATEAKVVALLKEQGINKNDLTRDEFLAHAWEWKNKYGGIILDQLKKLGASCDWDRTTFTMDNQYYKSVIMVFNDLYDKGFIYKGIQMVNWDPLAKTAVSDEEVIFKDANSVLYYVKYYLTDGEDYISIATTRPETIPGDVAICVNPNDERYKHLIGKTVIVPLIHREVPIISDLGIDIEFGTGALKVTPAHDRYDFELGKKYNLQVIDVFTSDGKMSEKAGIFVGEDRFKARKLAADQLESEGVLIKKEQIQNNIGYSERTNSVIEPKLSEQWFCNMQKLAIPALEAVMSDEVEFYPAKYKNVYRHWMENIRDWCISRQLWWGQRIPVWYFSNGQYVVALNEEEALAKAKLLVENDNLTLSDLRQDDDVLDTWFSSWLWPIATLNGILEPNNKEINYYYPSDTLVTGPDIIFFWVARMITSGLEYRKEEPFYDVYFTGIVRDSKGRKMSKQLGNSPDLLDLIKKFGADSVRFGVLVSSPAGNDLLFDEKLCEQGANFANKIWNAFRLVRGWELNGAIKHKSSRFNLKPVEWFSNKLKHALHEIDDYIEEYKLSEALTSIYKLIWDDFCSTYLEMIKPENDLGMDQVTYEATITFFEKLVALLHPFMPFLTEEIWHLLRERTDDDFCIIAPYPKPEEKADQIILGKSSRIIEAITGVRNIRNESNISPKMALDLFIRSDDEMLFRQWEPIITKMANITNIDFVKIQVTGAKSFTVKTDTFYVPITVEIDPETERIKLSDELDYTKGFLRTVMAKLANQRFIDNARPDVLDKEMQKKADAEARIIMLEQSLKELQQ